MIYLNKVHYLFQKKKKKKANYALALTATTFAFARKLDTNHTMLPFTQNHKETRIFKIIIKKKSVYTF
jgi:hypothetical protein